MCKVQAGTGTHWVCFIGFCFQAINLFIPCGHVGKKESITCVALVENWRIEGKLLCASAGFCVHVQAFLCTSMEVDLR